MNILDGKLFVFLSITLICWGILTEVIIRHQTSHELFGPIVIEFATRLEEVELNYQHIPKRNQP
jgi:hypothetical protein